MGKADQRKRLALRYLFRMLRSKSSVISKPKMRMIVYCRMMWGPLNHIVRSEWKQLSGRDSPLYELRSRLLAAINSTKSMDIVRRRGESQLSIPRLCSISILVLRPNPRSFVKVTCKVIFFLVRCNRQAWRFLWH
jgi:hypothetical protein